MASEACADTGPLLHLHEIGALTLLRIFDTVFITPYVEEELTRYGVPLPRNVSILTVDKDKVALLAGRYGLAVAESSVLQLGMSTKKLLLLTDDLEARQAAAELGLQPVGSVGIIVRAFREGKLTEEQAAALLQKLHKDSSLFITSTLIRQVTEELHHFAHAGKKTQRSSGKR